MTAKRTTALGTHAQANATATEHRGRIVSITGLPHKLLHRGKNKTNVCRLPRDDQGRSPSRGHAPKGGGLCCLSTAFGRVTSATRTTALGTLTQACSTATEHRGR